MIQCSSDLFGSVKLEEMLKLLRCELWPIIRNQLFWQAIGREQSTELWKAIGKGQLMELVYCV